MPNGPENFNQNNNPQTKVREVSYEVGITRLPNGSWENLSYEDMYGTGRSGTESPKFFEWQLTPQVYQIIVHDSLDMYFRTGQILLHDTNAMREFFPLTGNELISVKYKNLYVPNANGAGAVEKIYHFSIVGVKEIEMPGTRRKGTRMIALSLVEAPAYQLFTNNCIYKTFSWDGGNANTAPKKAHTISELINTTLKINPMVSRFYEIDVEDTLDTELDKINFYIPNWTIMKTLNYLRLFATNKENFPYFVVNIDPPKAESQKPTIRVRSIYSYMKSEKYHFFTNVQADALYRDSVDSKTTGKSYEEQEDENNVYEIMNTILNFGFDYFDRTQTAFAGLSGETFATFDYFADNLYVGYDYNRFKQGYSGLGNYNIHEVNYGNQWGAFRPHSFNEPNRLISMKRNEFAKSTIHSGMKAYVSSYVNNFRRVGDMCDFVFDNAMRNDYPTDQMMSVRWLLWDQTDKIAAGQAISECTFVRDGFEQILAESYKNRLTPMKNLNPVNTDARTSSQGDTNDQTILTKQQTKRSNKVI